MREWLRTRAGLRHTDFTITFYAGRYDTDRGSILPVGDITRFVDYLDLADWREPLVGTLGAVPREAREALKVFNVCTPQTLGHTLEALRGNRYRALWRAWRSNISHGLVRLLRT